jgi:hypothetical protein
MALQIPLLMKAENCFSSHNYDPIERVGCQYFNSARAWIQEETY